MAGFYSAVDSDDDDRERQPVAGDRHCAAFPSSCAALPGITMPMGLSAHGLPMGLEMDCKPGEDVKLLDLAAQVSSVLGSIPPPSRM
jgi:Asp-tRNA(Asn)/Glu-tRNA(Gln) amidotransferase A subunit family amidase